ncbi:MAG: class II fumarate hydratase [Pseudomonadota bacterium]|nr:class II fumarate hydratase [Pseudomonadota bacterium]
MTKGKRKERDSMGELDVPEDALWGAQTQRAVNNFPISDLKMPRNFIRALGLIKGACADVNFQLGLISGGKAKAIQKASMEVANGMFDDHFPVDVFQTGSGTSSNMNANEVIARLATKYHGDDVHPNDDVNMGQSSNDVIPTALHVGAAITVKEILIPGLEHLAATIETKSEETTDVIKTGRTHLMDAMPLSVGQEFSGWVSQIRHGIDRIEDSLIRLCDLAQGATAVGTGINAHPDLGLKVALQITKETGIKFSSASNLFDAISNVDSAVEMSGQIKTVAISITKISNDLRWMNSGPLAGLGEIVLPSLQPGSSIMPGKVNPVIPEALAMASVQVIGNDATITAAGQSGNFQLNVMLPVVAYNLLQSAEILGRGARLLADSCIIGLKINHENIDTALSRNPILVTALNSIIGYEKGAAIAKKAYDEGRTVREVAQEETDLSEDELDRLLNPDSLTLGGIKS